MRGKTRGKQGEGEDRKKAKRHKRGKWTNGQGPQAVGVRNKVRETGTDEKVRKLKYRTTGGLEHWRAVQQ